MRKTLKIFISFLLISAGSFSQNTTISPKNKPERENSSLNKIMIIPFEERMYFSEIDRNINLETKLSAKEIKYKFRDGLNEQLYKALKTAKFNVIDLMEDTAKYKKDLEGIYSYISYDYVKVPNQDNYKAPKKDAEQKSLEKGQLNVETKSEARFMNTKITNAKVIPILYGKHKTNFFLFINQLDVKSAGFNGPAELGDGNGNRKINVHYTVYSLDAKEINSGIAEEEFESTLNNPKKIIDKYFSKIATTIVSRINKNLTKN
jgi:hypothetical protein